MGELQTLLQVGRLAQLESQARSLTELYPRSGRVWKTLGVVLQLQGKDGTACLQRAAALLPEAADVQADLGNAYQSLHRPAEAVACYRRALELRPGHAAGYAALGSALLDLAKPAEAAASLQQALALDPTLVQAHGNLALALLEVGRPGEALVSIERMLQRAPELAEAHATRGVALLGIGRVEDATAAFERALALRPGFADALCNLATALRLQGRADDAIARARRVLALKPQSVPTMIVVAEAHADKGEFQAAEQMLRQAIALEPENPQALAALAQVRRMTADDASWVAAARRLAASGLTPRKEAMLRYALGKSLDDMQRYEEAFEEYRRANGIARAHRRPYDPTRQQLLTDSIIRTFDHDWIERRRTRGETSRKPVFIVGMPRSGTSLLEQILASHPAVFGAGELRFWQSGAARFEAIRQRRGTDSPAAVAAIGELGQQYRQQLDALAPDALRVIDKMPDNFRYLGLIHAALPDARIIHVRRHPVDTCLSIYFQDFKATLDYAHDLESLAHFYGEYARLMQHWQAVLPRGVMLEISYEGLVRDPERWTRDMLEFLALPWEPRCLEFQHTPRSVLTASRWQVRQKISQSSVARWRHYESHIGPLLALAGLSEDPGSPGR